MKVKIKGVLNARTVENKLNKIIIRSAQPSKITDKGIQKIKSLGINLMIDFRSNKEASDQEIKPIEGIKYVHIPILEYCYLNIADENLSMKESLFKIVEKGYTDKLFMLKAYETIGNSEYSFNAIKSIIDLIKNNDGGIMYFCSQGKDRTGIVSYLIERNDNKDDDYLINDYLYTNKTFRKNMRLISLIYILRKINKVQYSTIKSMLKADIDYLNKFIQSATLKFGSIDNYMKEIFN